MCVCCIPFIVRLVNVRLHPSNIIVGQLCPFRYLILIVGSLASVAIKPLHLLFMDQEVTDLAVPQKATEGWLWKGAVSLSALMLRTQVLYDQ